MTTPDDPHTIILPQKEHLRYSNDNRKIENKSIIKMEYFFQIKSNKKYLNLEYIPSKNNSRAEKLKKIIIAQRRIKKIHKYIKIYSQDQHI